MRETVFVDEISADFMLEERPGVCREIAHRLRAADPPPAPMAWGTLEERAFSLGLVDVVTRARREGLSVAQAEARLAAALEERKAAKAAVALAVKNGVIG